MTSETDDRTDIELNLQAYRQFATYRVSQLAARMNSHAAKTLKQGGDLGLVQWRILTLLQVAAPITSAALIKLIAMDAGLFSRNLKAMVADGLIDSRPDVTDQRQQILTLTPHGRAEYNRCLPAMQARRTMLMEGISAADKEIFFRTLDKIESNLARHLNEVKV